MPAARPGAGARNTQPGSTDECAAHLSGLARWAALPRRTVRLRLTALYGALFLASGAGLLTITNILARSWPWPPFRHPPDSRWQQPRAQVRGHATRALPPGRARWPGWRPGMRPS